MIPWIINYYIASRLSLIIWIGTALQWYHRCEGLRSYQNVTRVLEDKLGPDSGYNVDVRPVEDQDKVVEVGVAFDIVAIVEINAIQQKFVINGFLNLIWTDEIVSWEPHDFGSIYMVNPDPTQIWRPRLILGNTLDERDLFDDDYCPLKIYYDGNVTWAPGSLFPISCKLDLYKYPFDTQVCDIKMYAMGYTKEEVIFKPRTGVVSTSLYSKSEEWEMLKTSVVNGTSGTLTFFTVTFELKRRPKYFIISIIIPILLISFLNNLVFIIPVGSGEKISYGVTVLTALTFFQAIISDQMPKSSDNLPLVTVYLLILTIISVCTVLASILTVFFHQPKDQEEERQRKAASNFKGLFHKIQLMYRSVSAFKKMDSLRQKNEENITPNYTDVDIMTSIDDELKKMPYSNTETPEQTETEVDEQSDSCVIMGRQFRKHMNLIFFIGFTFIWMFATVGFLLETSR